MKKIGIITFHRSYNCGSMLETYALHYFLKKIGIPNEVIDFSNSGQRRLYAVFFECNTFRNILKNIMIFPHKSRIARNNRQYEEFKNRNLRLSQEFRYMEQLKGNYDIVIAGSDQIWNITIQDGDDAYFLPWLKKGRKVAYAPSFGAKNIMIWSEQPERYNRWIRAFDALSVRESNGAKWIRELTGREAEILPDPTLLLDAEEYEKLLDDTCTPKEDYIFFYSPSFQKDICRLVRKISRRYGMPVVVWNTKTYYTRAVYRYGFVLPHYESPAVYLSLIRNAALVITTSFHGTVFSTIFRKRFYVIKNGDMFGEDDRVWTLLESVKMVERLIASDYSNEYDYLQMISYEEYETALGRLREQAYDYLNRNVKAYCNEDIE